MYRGSTEHGKNTSTLSRLSESARGYRTKSPRDVALGFSVGSCARHFFADLVVRGIQGPRQKHQIGPEHRNLPESQKLVLVQFDRS
jgi:hypothetical protein